MARASSKTDSLTIQSPATGETRIVFERSYVKSTRVGGHNVTATKQFAVFDEQNRRYTRISSLVMTCVQSGERFHVVGSADRIRKSA